MTFKDELTQEVIRVLGLRRKAARAGRRSKATVQVKRLANKYGLEAEEVDLVAGTCILSAGLLARGEWARAIHETIEAWDKPGGDLWI